MRNIFLLILSISMITIFSCNDEENSNGLVGEWNSITDNGIKTINFTEDGDYIVHFHTEKSFTLKYSFDSKESSNNLEFWNDDNQTPPRIKGVVDFISSDKIVITLNENSENPAEFIRSF